MPVGGGWVKNVGLFAWSVAFSVVLVALGIGSAWVEVAKARRGRDDAASEFLSPRRTIRRLFTSAVLVALGVMIFWGVHFLEFPPSGIWFFAYWGVIFLLVAWLFLCPVFDMSETQRVYRSRMKNLAEQTIGPLRSRKGSGPPEPLKARVPEKEIKD